MNKHSLQLIVVVICFLLQPLLWGQVVLPSRQFFTNDQINSLNIFPGDPDFKKGRYDLKDYLYVLVDSTGELKFQDISAAELAESYVSLSEVSLSDLSMKRQAYWLRLSIESHLEEELNWLTNMMEAEVVAYSVTKDVDIKQKHSGILVPASKEYFKNQYGQLSALPISLPATGSRTYYWRVQPQPIFLQSETGLHLNLALMSPSYVSNWLQTDGVLLALFIGFLIAIGLYHLVIFFYNKELSYFWFFCNCLVGAFVTLIAYGYDLQYFFSEKPIFHYYLIHGVALLIWGLFFIVFSRSFLQMPKFTPFLSKVLWMVFGVSAIFLIVSKLVQWSDPPSGLLLRRIGMASIMITVILVLIIAFSCMKKGFQPAKLYLLACGASIAGVILMVLTFVFQVLPVIDHVNWAAIGTWIQLCLFAFGLARLFKQTEQQRILAQTEASRLTELNIVKNRLYTNITHEFRTPLTIIKGMTHNMKDDPEKWLSDGIQMINRNSDQLLQLINQILDLEKLESGKFNLHPVQSDIVAYIKYLLESFHSFAAEKEVSLHFLSNEESLVMDFAPREMRYIINNLLSNAIKYNRKGGAVFLKIDPKEGKLEITVEDTGIGIPEEQAPYIFNRFYQVDSESHRLLNKAGEGTGIGLALTRELVQLMGGEISVSSKAGIGTSLTFFLPIKQNSKPVSASELGIKNDPPSIAPASFTADKELVEGENAQPMILLVEDNVDVIYYLKSCLQDHYQLKTATNGAKGIHTALELIPDLIISDVMMPEKDGYELCATLKEDIRTSHIPIILLTAKGDLDSRMEGLEQGADAYLPKPFEEKELLIRIGQLIKLRKNLQEKYSKTIHLPTDKTEDLPREAAFLQQIRLLVEEHMDDGDFGIPELCQALHLSRMQVHRKLKALTNQTSSQIIRSIRLQKARTLLQTTDMNVSEVAYETGFRDPNHFSRVFREEFGVAPSEIRN